jgi:capsular polysaccharide biosynthesis protein
MVTPLPKRFGLGNRIKYALLKLALQEASSAGRWIRAAMPRFGIRLSVLVPQLWLDAWPGPRRHPLKPAEPSAACAPRDLGNAEHLIPVDAPAVELWLVDNACVCAHSSSVFQVDSGLIIERAQGTQPNDYRYDAGHIVRHDDGTAKLRIQDIRHLQRGIFVSGNGAGNYYHWLIELLPKLLLLDRLPSELADYPLLLSADVQVLPTFQQSLQLIATDRDIVYLKPQTSYVVQQLAYINAPCSLPFNLRDGAQLHSEDCRLSSSLLTTLRQQALSRLPRDAHSPTASRRLFLARACQRRNYNQEAVYAVLKAFGFVAICMEQMSFDEQVAAIHEAEIVVGPTGAAWTNLLFARPGMQALCWMAEEYGDFSAFSTLAGFAGVALHYLRYSTGISSTHALYRHSYEIDPARIRQALEQLGLSDQDGAI